VNLLLIGLRGAGKTTCGRAAARALSCAFVDLDETTAADAGAASVADAWKRLGEPAFRALEAAALERTLSITGQLIACGGGTPTIPGAAGAIRAERAAGRARVIYLRAPADTLIERLRSTDPAQRPSLTGAGTLEETPAILAQRDPAYLALADLVIQTEGLTTEETADLIAAAARAPLPLRRALP
jgi:shikimate kinase